MTSEMDIFYNLQHFQLFLIADINGGGSMTAFLNQSYGFEPTEY